MREPGLESGPSDPGPAHLTLKSLQNDQQTNEKDLPKHVTLWKTRNNKLILQTSGDKSQQNENQNGISLSNSQEEMEQQL